MMIWRLLASVLGGRRQPQIMKREQAMNDGKNKTDTLRSDRRAYRLMDRDDVLLWLFACLVCRALRCGDMGGYFGLQTTFLGRPFGVAGAVAKCASLGGN